MPNLNTSCVGLCMINAIQICYKIGKYCNNCMYCKANTNLTTASICDVQLYKRALWFINYFRHGKRFGQKWWLATDSFTSKTQKFVLCANDTPWGRSALVEWGVNRSYVIEQRWNWIRYKVNRWDVNVMFQQYIYLQYIYSCIGIPILQITKY